MDTIDVCEPIRSVRRSISDWVPAVALFVLASLVSGSASAERKILQNDSFAGIATFTQLASFDEQEIVAATFTPDPGDYPFRIEKVQILVLALFPGTIGFVSAAVWEDVGTVIPGPEIFHSSYGFQVESSVDSMNELSLSCENIVVDQGFVRVGLTWEYVGDPIGVAFDLDGITPATNTLFSSPLGGWWYSENLSVTGDWIMRIEIETNLDGTELFTDGFERGDSSCWP